MFAGVIVGLEGCVFHGFHRRWPQDRVSRDGGCNAHRSIVRKAHDNFDNAGDVLLCGFRRRDRFCHRDGMRRTIGLRARLCRSGNRERRNRKTNGNRGEDCACEHPRMYDVPGVPNFSPKLRAMAKTKASLFFCTACGHESARWEGRCPACEAWNTFAEAPTASATRGVKRAATQPRATAAAIVPIRLADVDGARVARFRSGIGEFDALLGGGIVPGSLVLLGGPPGAGKSTLLLQIAQTIAATGATAVYVCGEESAAQTKMRAQRLGVGDDVLVFAETNLRAILDELETRKPQFLIVDSIQTVWIPEVDSYAGSVSQVRDCAQLLMEFAKRTDCATFVVGHVTKDGTIAGPRLLEHLVDTVLYFEGDNSGEYRIVRAYKNRFGSADEICVFSMDESGLHEIKNPSSIFLDGRDQRPSGSCIVPSLVGSRPVLVEIQALVGETSYGTPRRLAANLDQARLAMIIAVLERRAGMALGGHDIYASVAGGLRVNEPAADLGIALAIASAFRNVPISSDAVAFGEIGLSGEIRSVSQGARRIGEAQKLGFREFVVPRSKTPHVGGGMHEVRDIAQAVRAALD